MESLLPEDIGILSPLQGAGWRGDSLIPGLHPGLRSRRPYRALVVRSQKVWMMFHDRVNTA